MNVRYIRMKSLDPGFRFDILKMQAVYSSRFLSREEHHIATWVEEAWAATFCFFLRAPALTREYVFPFMWDVFALFGIVMAAFAVILWILA